MITEKVNEALKVAADNNSSDVALLKMLTAQFNMAVRSRKSGDTLPNDKATVIINRLIEGIKRDQDLSGSPEDIANKKIQLLQSFL